MSSGDLVFGCRDFAGLPFDSCGPGKAFVPYRFRLERFAGFLRANALPLVLFVLGLVVV